MLEILSMLLDQPYLEFQFPEALQRILYESMIETKDLCDRIISGLGILRGCAETITFDKRAAGIEGMRLLV
jgi:predicted nucleic-acid-binding protein